MDRLSNLPKELLYIILSSIDMKQIVQMSTLSKQWRYLWKYVPYLNFDGLMWRLEDYQNLDVVQNYLDIKIEFIQFLTKVVNLRDGSSIKRFHLCCRRCSYENVRNLNTDELINSLVTRNIEEICFEEADISQTLLKCLANTIKTLKLIDTNIFSEMQDPSNDLRKLNLTCLTLENLTIQDNYMIECITIRAPCLKFLMIKKGTGSGNWWESDDREIKIYAPNLRYLHLKGGFFSDYSLENLSSLDDADVDTTIRLREEYAIEDWCLNKLLKGLVNAKSLTLSAHAFQGKTSMEVTNMFKEVSSFCNLRYFKLTKWRTSSGSAPALVKLFERFPCMETLVLEKTKKRLKSSTKEEEEWANQFVTREIFGKLKSVEIKGIEGSEDELKFLEFVLQKAFVLEKITITATSAPLTDVLDKLAEFSEKIGRFPQASSSVTIVSKLS